MKLAPVGIDPDHIEFTADHVSVEPFDLFFYIDLLIYNL